MQDLQERVAAGDAASYAEQPQLLHLIARRFEAQPPEIWAKRTDARALILYLLFGGASSVGRKILDAHSFAATETPLAKGAIAYLEGVEGVDRDTLLNLDPLALDVSLGAHVAFVQSILLASLDRPKALAKLDIARLLAPGGLVEEAALRREVGLLAETAEFDKFAGFARQYWQRFRKSPYAPNFLRQFLLSAARVSLRIPAAEWTQLDEFINSLKPETQRALYLVVAQTAAVGGNFALGDMAAGRVLDLSPENSVDRQRALLFALRPGWARLISQRVRRCCARWIGPDCPPAISRFTTRLVWCRRAFFARRRRAFQPAARRRQCDRSGSFAGGTQRDGRRRRAGQRRQKHGEENAMSALA